MKRPKFSSKFAFKTLLTILDLTKKCWLLNSKFPSCFAQGNTSSSFLILLMIP